MAARSFDTRQEARTAKLALWAALLDALDAAKHPEFDPRDVPAARVLVSASTPMQADFPLEAAEGIAHPQDRRNYEEAVKANAEKTDRYRFQKELRQLDAELTERAVEYIKVAHLRSQQALKQMNAAIAAIAARVHNKDRANYLRSLVRPRSLSATAASSDAIHWSNPGSDSPKDHPYLQYFPGGPSSSSYK